MSLSLKNDSLAFCLYQAALAVTEVHHGTALPQAIARLFQSAHISHTTQGAIQDISYRTIRHIGVTDSLLTLLSDKPFRSLQLHHVLCCALTLLVDRDTQARYDDFTVVNQAVEAIASDGNINSAKTVVNAILRRFLREKDTLLALAQKTPPGKWNYPTWWIDRVKAFYPAQWESILTVGNQLPPLTLRVNIRKTSVTDYLALLTSHDMSGTQIGPVAIRLDKAVGVQKIPGFYEGFVSVQDAAAQLAAPLLDVQNGMRVLDACAAPGGKTCHLLELADIQLQAIDQDPKRLKRIQENLDRLGLTATLSVGDARFGQEKSDIAANNWWDGQLYDRILADVPCTASGILRRHPDIRWLRRKTDAAQLAELSAQIVDNLWQKLQLHGKLLLVTCSIWPQESELQAQAFAKRHQALRLPAPGQLLPQADHENDHDGLFFALFEKTEASC